MGHVTGNGMMFGEYGGASELVWKALSAVAAASTARPGHAARRLLHGATGADSPERLLEGLSQGELSSGADAAPLVFQAADAGDAVAAECITWSGRELGSLAVGVIRPARFRGPGVRDRPSGQHAQRRSAHLRADG